jgi:hypothetical protein
MSNKALYRHKRSGDLFAIETDESGRVLSTSGPLLSKHLNPEALDYDNYWDPDIRANIDGFELLSKAQYRELLKQTGFFVQESQRATDCFLSSVFRIPSSVFRLPTSAFFPCFSCLRVLNSPFTLCGVCSPRRCI